MKRPSPVSQGSLEKLLKSADTAWEQKRFHEAIETLEHAVKLAPANLNILLRLGQFHGFSYDYTSAERCFEQAVHLSGRKVEILTAVAEHTRFFRDHRLAESYLARATREPDATPFACLRLAEVYERTRRLPEAGEMVERALKLNPAYPAAMMVKARLERLAGNLENAENLLRSFIFKPVPIPWTHVLSWYELAYVLDRQERYDEAMNAFDRAKSILASEAEKQFGKVTVSPHEYELMQSQLAGTQLNRWRDAKLSSSRPLALLCGYPRSGTTLLENVLDAHPEIISAEETDIFTNAALPLLEQAAPAKPILEMLETADPATRQKARENYFQSMELCLGQPIAGRLLVDKNPALTSRIPHFLRVFPEAKFIVALRDPRDVVLSRFMVAQPVVAQTTPFLTLQGTVSDYVTTMSLWRTLKPLLPDNVIEVRYEDMVENLESVARRTLEFLNRPWDEQVLGFDVHARRKVVHSPTYADVTQPVYKRARGRWHHYQKYLEPHLSRLLPFVKAFGYE